MSDSKWGQFANIDVAKLNQEVNSLERGYEELPLGKYEVALDNLALGLTKDGYPKLHATFQVVAGDYEGRLIFINQVLLKGDENDKYRVHSSHELLRSLKSSVTPITFEGLDAYEALVNRIADECFDVEYLLEISLAKGKKGATNDPNRTPLRIYTILERFDN